MGFEIWTHAISAYICKTVLTTTNSINTMTKKFLFFLSLATAALCLAACQKAELTLSGPSNLESAVSGGSASITFTATKDWTASASDSWVHISPASGKGSKNPVTVTVTCDPNNSYDDRSSTVTISSEGLKQTVTVKQGASNGLIVTTKSFEVGAAATTIEVAVQANVTYSAQTSAAWIRQSGTKALTESKIVFSIDENKAFEERNATITISGSGLSQTVTVKQAAAENPAKDLYGVWIATYGFQDGATQADYETMHVDILELKEDGTFETRMHSDVMSSGTWSFKDDKLSVKPADGQGVPPWEANVVLIGGKSWLVLVYDDEYEIDGTTYRNRNFDNYRKAGAAVESGTLTDGRWDAPHSGVKPETYTEETDYNLCLLVEGNNVDLYVPVWGLHIQGSFTFSNGKMHISTDDDHIWKAVEITGDSRSGSIGWNAGNLNSETFETRGDYKWYTINEIKAMGKKPDPNDPEYVLEPYLFKFMMYEYAENEHESAMDLCNMSLCVADSGKEAYGGFVGLNRCLYKR